MKPHLDIEFSGGVPDHQGYVTASPVIELFVLGSARTQEQPGAKDGPSLGDVGHHSINHLAANCAGHSQAN